MPQKVLHFIQPKMLHRDVTIAGTANEPMGELVYSSGLRTAARATFEGSQWTFTARGVMSMSVDIGNMQTGEELPGAFRKTMFGRSGTIEIAGTSYAFKQKGLGLLATNFVWTGQDGEEIIVYLKGGFFKVKGEIRIAEQAAAEATNLLVMLGLFLSLNSDYDATVAAPM